MYTDRYQNDKIPQTSSQLSVFECLILSTSETFLRMMYDVRISLKSNVCTEKCESDLTTDTHFADREMPGANKLL